MEDFGPLFLIPATTGPIFVLAGYLLQRFPPKKINGLYGYRTPSSMKSQARWDFAQQYAAREIIEWGSYLALMSVVGLLISVDEGIGVLLGILVMVGFIFMPIFHTEKALKEKFGNG